MALHTAMCVYSGAYVQSGRWSGAVRETCEKNERERSDEPTRIESYEA